MIKVTVKEGIIEVESPYNKEFIEFARMRKAIWDRQNKVWQFDPRDEFAVRSTLVDVYGTDDYENCEKVDVRIDLDKYEKGHLGQRLFALGRELAYRKGRDWYVDIGEGVAVVKGGFPDQGGSMKHPDLDAWSGTVLEVRDVPKPKAEQEYLANKEAIQILNGLNKEKLQQEKERLLKRLEEVEQLLQEAEEEVDEEQKIYSDLQD